MGRHFALLLGLLACAGCGSYRVAASARSPRPSGGFGVVCVANIGDAERASAVPVWDNGYLVGAGGGGTHFCYAAYPGKHRLRSELLVTSVLGVVVHANREQWIVQRTESETNVVHSGGTSRGYRSGGKLSWVELAVPSAQELGVARQQTRLVTLVSAPFGEAMQNPKEPVPALRE